MLYRRVLVFVVVLGAAATVNPGPAWGQTINVTTTADETTANGQTSLREAFIAANTNGQNDVIQLQAGAHYLLDFCAAGPLTHTATQALTIQGGAGTTLQNTCASMQTIVDTDGTAGLTITALEITGFFVDDGPRVDGAAVQTQGGGPLALNYVSIHGFSSGPSGNIVDGGDFGTHATLTNTLVYGNQGNGLSLSFGSLTLNNSQIHDNDGGGASMVDGSPVVINGSSVNNNTRSGVTTTGQGYTAVTVTNSHIDGNGEGGLYCSACGSIAIAGSSLNLNGSTTTTIGGGVRATWDYDSPDDAPVLSITNSTIVYNRAARPGAGVSVDFIEDSEPSATPGALNISGSNISGNVTEDASDLDGAGIFATTGNITISNGSSVNGNHAGVAGSADGGGIWHRELADLNGTRTLSVANSSVSHNEAGGSGGGIFAAHDGTVAVTGSTLNGNTADSLSGGAMSTFGTTTTVTTSKVQGNEADVGGGLAHTAYSGLPVGSVTVDRSTLSGNTATFGASGGGGIFVNVGGAGALATVRNSTVAGNTSANYGGGVMVMQTSRLTLDHATVVDNTGATGANLYDAAGTFRTRHSVIGLAKGTGSNCAFFSAPGVSEGYSWTDDASCTLGPNDVVAPGVDPQLAPLAMNGGPTPTRKPNAHSPLSLVPKASCTIPTDQRGTSRPQGAKCEAGAVEITEAAPK